MGWNDKYWDTIDQLYWTPDYVGLRSLTVEVVPERPEYLLIPHAEVPSGNSVYTRRLKSRQLIEHLHTLEEPLNHVLDIGLAIAPDALIGRLIAAPLGITDAGPFESIGREVDERYGLKENVFQQDGLFVSRASALALEIKLQSSSSPEQIIKYGCLLALEDQKAPKQKAGLLYVIPEGDEARLWQACGLDTHRECEAVFDIVVERKKSAGLLRLMAENEARVREMLSRMRVACVTWRWLRDQIFEVESTLSDLDPGQQCYRRLLHGLRKQIESHVHTGVQISERA